MSPRTIAVVMILCSLALAVLTGIRGLAQYDERVAEVRECQRAGGGDRECWRAHR